MQERFTAKIEHQTLLRVSDRDPGTSVSASEGENRGPRGPKGDFLGILSRDAVTDSSYRPTKDRIHRTANGPISEYAFLPNWY